MSRAILQSKVFGETRTYQFDFTSLLASGETISTATTTAAVYSGTDATPANVISGAASFSGAVVSQNITDGVQGVTYSLTCTITTSASQTLKLNAFMTIIPTAP